MPNIAGSQKSPFVYRPKHTPQQGANFLKGVRSNWINLLDPITKECYIASLDRIRKVLVSSSSTFKLMR